MADNGTNLDVFGRNRSYLNSTNGDYFDFVFSDTGTIAVAVVSWCSVQIIGLPLLLGLVAYERYGSFNYRTLINSLHCYGYTLMVIYCLSGFNILIIRVLFGPLPGPVCSFDILQKRGFILGILLSVSECFVLRYLYSCVWKNVGFLNDEFFGAFLISLNTLFSLAFVALSKMFGDHHARSFNYAVCAGRNPNLSLDGEKFDILIVIFTSCTILCLSLNTLTHLRQPRVLPEPVALPASENQASVKNIFELSKVFECFAVLLIPVSFVPNIICKSAVRQNLVKDVLPVLVMGSLFAPTVSCLCLLPLALYASRPRLRRRVAIQVGESEAGRMLKRCLPLLQDGMLSLNICRGAQLSPPPPAPPSPRRSSPSSNNDGGSQDESGQAGVPHEEHPKLAWEGVEGVVFHADEDRILSSGKRQKRESRDDLGPPEEICVVVSVE